MSFAYRPYTSNGGDYFLLENPFSPFGAVGASLGYDGANDRVTLIKGSHGSQSAPWACEVVPERMKQTSKQANKQTSKQANKQTNKQANKQTNN
jgi:hypothetical protein